MARGGVSDSKAYHTETVVGVVFMKQKKKGNTNGCDRTGLFSSQTAVQHQTECVCVRPGDIQLQRLTEADTLELLCQADMGCQSQTSLSKPTLNLFLKGYI